MVRTFYRIIKSDPPTLEDFKSYRQLGIPLIGANPESGRLAEGLSVYATLAQARRAARVQSFLGSYIAELAIPDDAEFTFERTGKKPGHHTIWGSRPERLAVEVLARVASVMPVETPR